MNVHSFIAAATIAASLGCGACTANTEATAPASTATGSTAKWDIVFPTSASGDAQAAFLRGMAAMHLFMYPDAAAEFQAAQKASPGFALAYWGEALTHYQPIWREFDRDAGRAAMHKLGDTPAARLAKAATPREKAYVATLDVLYGDGDQAERLMAYSLAMEDLSASYPDDDEARALWALSRVVQYPRTERGMQERMKTAAIAQQVLSRHPNHPGAVRYLIQSVNDPVHADLGLLAADAFLPTRPESSEARHMPTHIFSQVGRWKEMADLNWEAFELSMDWTRRHGYQLKDLNNHNYGHLLTYAQYGYLQRGQHGRARDMIARARSDYEASGKSGEIANTLANTLAQYVVETGDPKLLGELEALASGAGVESANVHYAIGLVSARNGDAARVSRALDKLGEGQSTNARIMRNELAAAVALGRNDSAAAIRLLGEAAAIDEKQIYVHFGPPGPFKPPHELYGQTLMTLKRPAEALTAFEDGLRIYRGRTALLLGAARASAASGKPALAAKYHAQLRDTWKEADPDLAALKEIAPATH